MNTYFTVGPSAMYPTYQNHLQDAMSMQLGSISHRSAAFRKIYQHTDEQLKLLLNIPKEFSIFFTPSATEIWERILLNVVEQNSFHLIQGAFSSKFYDFSKALQKSPKDLRVEAGFGFDNLNELKVPSETELICTTQNETSSGIQIPSNELKALNMNNPHTLLCTDIVSSAPYVSLDFNYIDSAFFSVQKAFGMPAGLGVWIINEACITKAHQVESKGINIGAHHTISAFEKNYQKFETPSTPNVIAIYILGKIAEDMNRKGIDIIRDEINLKHEMLKAFENSNEFFSFKSNNANHLSKTVTVLDSKINSSEVIERMKAKGYVLASGYGTYKTSQIRIANFPSSSPEEMEQLIDGLKE